MRTARGYRRAIILAIASIALVGACSSSSASPSAASGITVTGAWVRASTAMTGALAGYLVITNNGSAPDSLTKASSPIAKTVQVHETVAVSSMPAASGMGGMGSAMPSASAMGGMGSAMPSGPAMSMGSMMTMREVEKIDIPAGGTVELKPGSYHIMFMDLTSTPTAGQTVDITLQFAKAGAITVKAEVRAQ